MSKIGDALKLAFSIVGGWTYLIALWGIFVAFVSDWGWKEIAIAVGTSFLFLTVAAVVGLKIYRRIRLSEENKSITQKVFVSRYVLTRSIAKEQPGHELGFEIYLRNCGTEPVKVKSELILTTIDNVTSIFRGPFKEMIIYPGTDRTYTTLPIRLPYRIRHVGVVAAQIQYGLLSGEYIRMYSRVSDMEILELAGKKGFLSYDKIQIETDQLLEGFEVGPFEYLMPFYNNEFVEEKFFRYPSRIKARPR